MKKCDSKMPRSSRLFGAAHWVKKLKKEGKTQSEAITIARRYYKLSALDVKIAIAKISTENDPK